MDRRKFLINTGTFLGVGIFVTSAASIITACEHDPGPISSDLTVGSIKISNYPVLAAAGGVVQVLFPGRNQDYPVFVVKRTNDFIVLSSICQHQGFQLNMPKNGVMTCPGHSAQYSANDGSVLRLPSTGDPIKPLMTFPYSIDQATQVMTINFA